MSLSNWENKKTIKNTQSMTLKEIIIFEAIDSEEKIYIKYTKPNGSHSNRWVTFKSIFSKQGEPDNYAEAFCHQRGARRVFMIKRITII